MKCSECAKSVPTHSMGRPRLTCGDKCYRKRRSRCASEAYWAEIKEMQEWWLSLTAAERKAAMEWVDENPPPKKWNGGRQAWSFYSRINFLGWSDIKKGL